ncbi:MAG: hypothetical protein LBB89_01110 [Treponema sp.]|jgi:hypothetical protein|nr:hypothetical protein [Treponema sp.]
MKNMFKLLGIIVLRAVIGFSMATCEAEIEGEGNDGGGGGGGGGGIKPTITVKNNTGYSCDIYIKPSTEAKSWGGDLTGWYYNIEDGKSQDFTLDQPLSVHKVYDIRLEGGGYNFIQYGVTVSNKMTITFSTDNLNNMSSLPKITIQNRSGKSFDSVYIVPSALNPSNTSDWGESWGGISNNDDKSDINILIPPTNYTVFDIQAKSSNPTNTYTKTNVTISNGMTILFTPLDRVNSTIEDPIIVIQNSTGYSCDVYIKQSGTYDWGNDLTGWYYNLNAGNSQTFSVSRSLGSQIDIKLSGSGYDFIKYNVSMSDGLFLTFNASDNN